MKKIEVPEGMLRAVQDALHVHWRTSSPVTHESSVTVVLEAALLWLSENPIAPTIDQLERIWEDSGCPDRRRMRLAAVEWQRRMFLAPEPEIPEEVKDLLWAENHGRIVGADGVDARIIEAYRRGQKAGK